MLCFRNSTVCLYYALVAILIVFLGILCLSPRWPRTSDVGISPNLANRKTVKCPYYSPAYPTAGFPGCSPECISRDGKKNSSYGASFHNNTHSWPKDLVDNMHRAADVLKKYGTPTSLNTERSHIYLHMAFDYYCCYTPEEGIKIGEFLNAYTWTPHEVWFDKMVCAIHGTEDMVSIVLMLGKKSQEDMLQWALDNERDLEAKAGVHKHIPHTHLQEFHMTLATVNQSVFPVLPALEEINSVIPPKTWHSTPVVLHKPVCNKCERLMSTMKKGVTQ